MFDKNDDQILNDKHNFSDEQINFDQYQIWNDFKNNLKQLIKNQTVDVWIALEIWSKTNQTQQRNVNMLTWTEKQFWAWEHQ